jgi:hypothetical protein
MVGSFRKTCVALALAAATASTPAFSQTIANGGFDQTSPSGSYQTVSSLPGWTVSGDIDLIGSYWSSQAGGRSIDLNGNGPGGISQTITGLTPGTTYIVSFFISGNPDNSFNPNPKTALLTLGSGPGTPISYTLTAANTSSTMNWLAQSYSFVASGTTAFLGLQSTTAGSWGMAVDSFVISAAPEPATWGMMIMGFGIAGLALRRRRSMVAATA